MSLINETIHEETTFASKPLELRLQRIYAVKVGTRQYAEGPCIIWRLASWCFADRQDIRQSNSNDLLGLSRQTFTDGQRDIDRYVVELAS